MNYGETTRDLLVDDGDVSSLAGSRVYLDMAPGAVELPHIVVRVISDNSINTLQGSMEDFGNARVQVDCYAKAYTVVWEMAKRVEKVLGRITTPTLGCMRLQGNGSRGDEDTWRCVSADYSMWMRG